MRKRAPGRLPNFEEGREQSKKGRKESKKRKREKRKKEKLVGSFYNFFLLVF